MNIKLALASLLVSVVMSCGVSEGQLLDRMLTKAGCSSCGAAASGCSGGLLSKGCGSAEPCGLGLGDKLQGRLAGGCGCAAPVADCGCQEAAPIVESSCGCGSAAPAPAAPCSSGGGASLLQNLRARYDGGMASGGCGCEAALPSMSYEPTQTPVFEAAPVSSCGCSGAAPALGGGSLLDRLKKRLSSLGNGGGCGCSAAPVQSCGCDAAPAPVMTPVVESSCGCSAPAPAPSSCGCSAPAPAPAPSSCGCGSAAPAVSSCGCGAGVASGSRPQLTLLDRLRGNRISRDRDGRVIGAIQNGGCNPPCPQADSGCGCGGYESAPVSAPVVDSGCSSCSSCQGEIYQGGAYQGDAYQGEIYQGEVYAAPAAGAVIYGDDSSTSGETIVTEEAAPAPVSAVEPAKVKDVIKEALPKANATPEVDPNAFIAPKGQATS